MRSYWKEMTSEQLEARRQSFIAAGCKDVDREMMEHGFAWNPDRDEFDPMRAGAEQFEDHYGDTCFRLRCLSEEGDPRNVTIQPNGEELWEFLDDSGLTTFLPRNLTHNVFLSILRANGYVGGDAS